MFKLKIKGEEFPMKNQPNELTIGEYENLCAILNDDSLENIDKYFKAFVSLGMDIDILDSLDAFSFLRVINEFKGMKMDIGEMKQTIELNGRIYQSFTDEFFFTVKDMKMIESAIKKNPKFYIAEIIAIIFKDIELTKAEHYDNAHIKYKAKLIRDVITYDVALPFVSSFSTQLISSLEAYKND